MHTLMLAMRLGVTNRRWWLPGNRTTRADAAGPVAIRTLELACRTVGEFGQMWTAFAVASGPSSDEVLNFYQDRVASEAYLDAARRRASVREHARLVDYVVQSVADASPERPVAAPGDALWRYVDSLIEWGDKLLEHESDESLDERLEDLFVETAPPWTIPYLGDLLSEPMLRGVRPLVADALARRRRSQREEIAPLDGDLRCDAIDSTTRYTSLLLKQSEQHDVDETADTDLAYLEVWERSVSSVQDPGSVEPALGEDTRDTAPRNHQGPEQRPSE